MAGTSEHFRKLLLQIALSKAGKRRADGHFATISTRLRSGFQPRKIEVVGSYSRGAALTGHSGLDCFAVFSKAEAPQASTRSGGQTTPADPRVAHSPDTRPDWLEKE